MKGAFDAMMLYPECYSTYPLDTMFFFMRDLRGDDWEAYRLRLAREIIAKFRVGPVPEGVEGSEVEPTREEYLEALGKVMSGEVIEDLFDGAGLF